MIIRFQLRRPWTAVLLALSLATFAVPARGAEPIRVVAAENFYGDLVQQIGGPAVSVTSILSDPNVDPHEYESSSSAAAAIAAAQLVVQNGVGYDEFMNKLQAASPSRTRVTIDAGTLLGRKTGGNPHLWYEPATLNLVARRVAQELARIAPERRAAFAANERTFEAALRPWGGAIARIAARFHGTPVAVTEPVFNSVLQAARLDIRTPVPFQLAVEEGNDPSPQDAQAVRDLLAGRVAKAFVYNRQTVEPATTRLLAVAKAANVPIVGVTETMPAGTHVQAWLIAETQALDAALAHGVSTGAP